LPSQFHTVHFVWNKVLEVLESSNRIWKRTSEHRTTPTNNDDIGAATMRLNNDNRPTEHLDIDFRPDIEQGSNRIEHQADFKVHQVA